MSDHDTKPPLLTEAEISTLPQWARLALATRCAQRVHIFNASELGMDYERVPIAQEIISQAERRASGLRAYDRGYDDGDLDDWYDCFPHLVEAIFIEPSPESVFAVIERADHHLGFAAKKIRGLVNRDFELLAAVASEQHWTDETPIPAGFFSYHSEFALDADVADQPIIEIASFVNERLLEYFRKHPSSLYQLSPRQFEEVIAEIWDAFGFDVELTQRTRDGGKDIVAVRKSPDSLLYLIECKRYAPNRPIGIEMVQRLYGVTHLAGADKGLLVTTSRFTRPAKQVLEKAAWLLEGHDLASLTDWLDRYQKVQMYRHLELQPPRDVWKSRLFSKR
jgi:hypothetical protein